MADTRTCSKCGEEVISNSKAEPFVCHFICGGPNARQERERVARENKTMSAFQVAWREEIEAMNALDRELLGQTMSAPRARESEPCGNSMQQQMAVEKLREQLAVSEKDRDTYLMWAFENKEALIASEKERERLRAEQMQLVKACNAANDPSSELGRALVNLGKACQERDTLRRELENLKRSTSSEIADLRSLHFCMEAAVKDLVDENYRLKRELDRERAKGKRR